MGNPGGGGDGSDCGGGGDGSNCGGGVIHSFIFQRGDCHCSEMKDVPFPSGDHILELQTSLNLGEEILEWDKISCIFKI